jgi:opacity protein-like surface antigen
MRNIKTLAAFFLFFLPAYGAMAQVNFVAGSIIQLNGDTLNGEIDYQEWIYNPKFIRFRKNAAQTAKAFAPKDVKGFMIAGRNEKYQTAIVKVNNETMDAANGNMTVYESVDDINNASIVWTQDTVFLSVIAQGRLNLYELSYYVDSKTHFFIQQDKGKIDELIYRRVKLQNHDTLAVSTIFTYRTQLRNLTQDCTPNPNTNLLPYTRQRILKFTNEYNNCVGQSYYNINRGGEESPKYLLIMAGTMRPFIRFSDYYNYDGSTYNGPLVPSFGFAYEMSYRFRSKLAFGIEVNFAPYKAAFSTTTAFTTRTLIVNYKTSAYSTKVCVYLRYNFLTGSKLRPYVKAGLGVNSLSAAGIDRTFRDNVSTTTVELSPMIFQAKQYQYLIALGLNYNHWFIEPRLDNTLDKLISNENRAISSRLSVLGGYSFNLFKNKK